MDIDFHSYGFKKVANFAKKMANFAMLPTISVSRPYPYSLGKI